MGASQVPMEMSLSRLRVAESASKSQNRRIPVRNSLLSDTAASLRRMQPRQQRYGGTSIVVAAYRGRARCRRRGRRPGDATETSTPLAPSSCRC